MPLGLSGLFNFINANVARYATQFGWLTYILVIVTGWLVYSRPTGRNTKIMFWVVTIVSVGLVNYLQLSNWFLKTFIY